MSGLPINKVSVARVNKVLAKLGGERLRRGRGGYYYFCDGDTGRWPVTMVMVNRVDALTVDQWVAERNRLASAA